MSAETPSSFRRTARTLRLMMLDAADALLGRRKDLVPPRTAIQSIGGSDFEAIGRHLTEVFAASVFTHLTGEAVRHYLHETHRGVARKDPGRTDRAQVSNRGRRHSGAGDR
jgi:hypothetical protein